MNSLSNRSKVIEKVKALLARSVGNGCTEAEAMEATKKVGKIMEEHELSMSEVDVRAEANDCCADYYDTGKRRNNPGIYLLQGIEEFFGVKSWIRFDSTNKYVFFGMPADVESAKYLAAVLIGTMEREAVSYLKLNGGGRTAGVAFRQAFATRVSQRLTQMARERKKELARNRVTGRELVVLKDQLVDQKYRGLALRFNGSPYRASGNGDSMASQAGYAAGERAGLTKGVGKDSESFLLLAS